MGIQQREGVPRSGMFCRILSARAIIMDVLITNDDGIRAIGLRALYTALKESGHTVHVVAPMRQQSGVGHSLTVFEPLRGLEFEEENFHGFGVYGTPTDCVKLALGTLLENRPDLVLSGINAGPNVGPDILYSGTVGAATEGCHENLPTMAISNDETEPVDILAKARHAVHIAEVLDWKHIPPRRVINVNYPRGRLNQAKGIKVCAQTTAVWKNSYQERRDPRGMKYWWLEGEIPAEDINAGSDRDLLTRGFITLTPLCFDFTDRESIRRLNAMDFI